MQSLIKCLIDICLLRAAPQDLPASLNVMGLCLGAYLLSNLALSSFDAGLGRGLLMALADAVVLAACLRLALRWRGHAARFVQTFTALTGSGALLGLLAIPLLGAVAQGRAEAQPAGIQALFWLMLVVWSLLVLGHILRHALSTTLANGVLLGLGYTVLSFVMLQGLMPVPD